MKIISKKVCLTALAGIMTFMSCNKFLEVIPDNTVKFEDVFNTKEDAYNALAKVYSYLPDDNRGHRTSWLMGDEYCNRLDINNSTSSVQGIRIMRGLQSASNPILGNWVNGYYQAIRQCNIFLEYVGTIKNMPEDEKEEWRGQVMFLKAYYHWLLLQKYGPIIIADKVIAPDALDDELFQYRSKVEDCFNYIIDLIDMAIPKMLPVIDKKIDYGMVDQMIAKSIKARILLFRASPFYNGNMEYFGDFLDFDEEPFFPIEYDKEKWKDAAEAIEEAIEFCEAVGKKLYTCDREASYNYDREFFKYNEDRMKLYWDLRMVLTDPWNSELIWGMSKADYYGNGTDGNAEIGALTSMRLPNSSEFTSNDKGANLEWCGQWLCASYQVAERYYTENGVPIEEDRRFPYNGRQQVVKTPDPSISEYDSLDMVPLLGILQPNAETVQLYMNREMRFYANLGITGGYWRSHQELVPLMMFWGQYGGGGVTVPAIPEASYVTGIAIQKFTHPESGGGGATSNNWQRIRHFPYPIIRLADLYLMKAEAWNEYEGPSQKVYDAINMVRRRAGIPDVEVVWADPAIVRTVGKHTTQSGMRDIILRERSIEFAFEGSRFWDMLRYRRAPSEFSKPIMGWYHQGGLANTFFVLGIKQHRSFSIRDCLWPINIVEINKNRNLIQNPGW